MLAQDQDFVNILESVWQIELSVRMLSDYRVLVMCRQPLVRTDSGYHVPSTGEIIAGIEAYFDPALLSDHADVSIVDEESELLWIGAFVVSILQETRHMSSTEATEVYSIQPNLLRSSLNYSMLTDADSSGSTGPLHECSDFTVPLELSDAISKVSTVRDLQSMRAQASNSVKLSQYFDAWIDLHICLEKPNAGPACECPIVYFFIKYCLDQRLGVLNLPWLCTTG